MKTETRRFPSRPLPKRRRMLGTFIDIFIFQQNLPTLSAPESFANSFGTAYTDFGSIKLMRQPPHVKILPKGPASAKSRPFMRILFQSLKLPYRIILLSNGPRVTFTFQHFRIYRNRFRKPIRSLPPSCCSKMCSSRRFCKRFRFPKSPSAALSSMMFCLPHWQSCACSKTAIPGGSSSRSVACPPAPASPDLTRFCPTAQHLGGEWPVGR